MKKVFFVLSAFALLLNCTGEKGRSSGSRFLTLKTVDKLMEEKYIFNLDTAYNRLSRASKDQKTKSHQLFLQGLDLYINQKNATESIKLFRESILYCPDYNTYTYLGSAYVDAGDTLRADSALNDYDMPDSDRLYASARLSAYKKDTATAISLLTEAFGNGFLNKKRFEADKVFDYLREERGFAALVVTYLKDDVKLQAALFKHFIAEAPDLALPYSFNEDSITLSQNGGMEPRYIDYDFAGFVPGMESGRFSRDVSNGYYMIGKMKLNNGMYAVLHRVVMMIVDTLAPLEVKMMVYDSSGTILNETTFAKYTLPETLITGSIDKDRVITLRESKMKWKTNPLENGYDGNEYAGSELISETRFVIDESGKATPKKEEVVKQ